MVPLHTTLIGLSEPLQVSVRQALAEVTAVVDGEFHGADSALEALRSNSDIKQLLIVHFERLEDAIWLRRLVETFGDWPILALVEVAGNPDHLIAANRAEAAQVVPLPLQTNDFQAALDCLAVQFGPRVQDCQTIAVAGAVAGAAAGDGATTVALNLGYEIATRHNRKTVLVELVQQMGVLASYLDVEPAYTLADLLGEKGHLDGQLVAESLVPVATNFQLLAGTRNVADAGPVPSVPDVRRVLDFVKRQAEVVLIDVPSTYNDFQ